MLKKRMNNKGAVEMSLNLIIMLVIGLTVMGLIIAFVTNFLNDAGAGFQQQLDEQDSQKLAEVKSKSGNLAFLSTAATVGRGETGSLYMKLENPTSSQIPPSDIFDVSSGVIPNSDGTTNFYYEISGQQAETSGDSIVITGPPMELDASRADSFKLDLNVGDDVVSGIYYLTFRWEDAGSRNYSERVTLTVE